ncbi:MAG: hypothetical protein QOJ12_473 [Thermoleophilales bacterium]|nr:hypothetical protein [Thermoleophilales bacterium]
MRLSLRAGALLAAGSLAVHELRYVAGWGDPGAVGGHGYLAVVAPLVALLLALACGIWLARIGRAVTTPAGRGTLTWFGASVALLGVYVVQETLEALATSGHPDLLARSGWIVVPIAIAVGGVVALLLHGAHAAEAAVAAVTRPWSPLAVVPVAAPTFALPAAPLAVPRTGVLARRLAGRAPPLAS